MKKTIAAMLLGAQPLQPKISYLRSRGLIAIAVLTGCTTTHVQWDAVQMRQQVVDYYNDEIMDNLVRAVNGQPFVHVDIAGLQAVTGSKLAGAVTGGQTETHVTGTNPAATAAGVVATFTRTAMRPFGFSVNPERSENLTITSVPVIGASGRDPDVYNLYLQFLNLKSPPAANEAFPDVSGKTQVDFSFVRPSRDCESVQKLCTLEERRLQPAYVPGTRKDRGDCVYYVPIAYQKAYLGLFRALLTTKRPTSIPPSPPSLLIGGQ